MKALTIDRPWSAAIIHGIKTIENRSYPINYRGPLAIHVSKRLIPLHFPPKKLRKHLLPLAPIGDLPRGVIIGIVDLVDCQLYRPEYHIDIFATGPWCWILKNPRKFIEPIPCQGKQGLWNVPEEIWWTRGKTKH